MPIRGSVEGGWDVEVKFPMVGLRQVFTIVWCRLCASRRGIAPSGASHSSAPGDGEWHPARSRAPAFTASSSRVSQRCGGHVRGAL